MPDSFLDNCRCERCGKRCGTCNCPPASKQKPAARRADEKRRRTPKRQTYQEQRRTDAERDGLCITCQRRPPEDGSKRCRRCLDRIARNVWIGKVSKLIRSETRFVCDHEDDPATCATCKRCVREWLRANEDEVRAVIKRGRSAKIRAASAARDLWAKRRRGQRQFVRERLLGDYRGGSRESDRSAG